MGVRSNATKTESRTSGRYPFPHHPLHYHFLSIIFFTPFIMQVFTDAFDSVDLEPRPVKRQRAFKDSDDGHRPYTVVVPGSSGLLSEGDISVEGTAKKPRKRPLSCGECRRCAYMILSQRPILTLPLQIETKGNCGGCEPIMVTYITLQCDRVFPCQSCCKRGCAEICPDGALTGGKGSRLYYHLH